MLKYFGCIGIFTTSRDTFWNIIWIIFITNYISSCIWIYFTQIWRAKLFKSWDIILFLLFFWSFLPLSFRRLTFSFSFSCTFSIRIFINFLFFLFLRWKNRITSPSHKIILKIRIYTLVRASFTAIILLLRNQIF